MRHNDLKEALQSAGWRIAENPVRDAINEADWYAWLPGRNSDRKCLCNDKPPAVTVNPSQFDMRGHVYASAEIRLTGEIPNRRWVDFKVYSVPMTEVIDALPSALQTLESAWVASWDAAKQTKDTE